MEYSTFAHEFGHHVLGHRHVDDDPDAQEFEADAYTIKICERVEFEPFPLLSNPYCRTGAGASLMLLALCILLEFERADSGIVADPETTHPQVSASPRSRCET